MSESFEAHLRVRSTAGRNLWRTRPVSLFTGMFAHFEGRWRPCRNRTRTRCREKSTRLMTPPHRLECLRRRLRKLKATVAYIQVTLAIPYTDMFRTTTNTAPFQRVSSATSLFEYLTNFVYLTPSHLIDLERFLPQLITNLNWFNHKGFNRKHDLWAFSFKF